MSEPKETSEVPKKSSGGLGMIGLALLGAAAMGGSFGVSFLLNKPAEQVVAACEPTMEEAEVKPAKKVSANQRYVELDEILITIGSEPATRYLKINASIVTQSSLVKDVEKAQPLLIDAFNYYLRSVEVSDFENPAFYPHLREQLGRRAELVLGGEVSQGVLITEFLLR
ncbi:MAG: flagellar basal body-associated FliL family protein [Pseudomonadota bacterium]